MARFSSIVLFLSVFSLLAGLPFFVQAQSITEQSRKDSISISASPSYPEPGEEVALSVSSFLVSLPGAQIQWNINNQIVASGGGETEINYTMPESGQAASIQLQINPADRSIITKNFTLQPATIDLLWEVNTYTPPFYKGKALYTGVDTVNVTAIPFIQKPGGGQYEKDNLVYKWSYNGLVHGNDSGLGKRSFPVDVNQANNSVSVVISNRSGDTVGEASVSIPSTNPELLFYERTNPGLRFPNVLTEEENSVSRTSNIVAYPYFSPTESAQSDALSYQWYIDNNSISPSVSKNEMSLRDVSNSDFDLSASVENTEFIFPTIQTTAPLTF